MLDSSSDKVRQHISNSGRLLLMQPVHSMLCALYHQSFSPVNHMSVNLNKTTSYDKGIIFFVLGDFFTTNLLAIKEFISAPDT